MSANRSTGGGVKNWRQQTRMVRGGLARSGFEETAEAIYMTSGYVYQSAEEAEAAFKGEVTRFVYSRYANPTVAMFEERLRLLEGAETCRGTASGMAAVFAALMCQLRAGDRVVSGVKNWRQQTRMVRGGLARSGFEETAEAIYMTSGYVYQSAEEAEAAFKGEVTRFVYSRYANPTVAMFEERLRLLEGAETCRGTASGMAAVFASLQQTQG